MKRNDRYNKQRLKEMNKTLQKCDLLIIDEISMVSSELMDMIRYRLKQGKFKGSILFVGDFFQLPPVVKKSTGGLWQDSLYAFESSAWEVFEPRVVMLKQPKRTKDMQFFSILNRIRKGVVDEEAMTYLNNLRKNVHVNKENPTVLFGTNKEADVMNREKLREIESELVSIPAVEVLHDKSLHVKRLESWKKALPIPPVLELKLGATVIFCTNKWGKYYNGERGIVKDIDEEFILVQKDDTLVKVERHEFTLHENVVLGDEIEQSPLASLHQFPIKLAYAITIHKSQGMSIDSLVCNVDNIFETSQFYVAVSRAKNPKSLYIHYSRDNFHLHVNRCVRVDERVVDFYKNSEQILIEDEASLF